MNDADFTPAGSAPDPELARRIAAGLDGTITPEDFAALEQQLAHDPAAHRRNGRLHAARAAGADDG